MAKKLIKKLNPKWNEVNHFPDTTVQLNDYVADEANGFDLNATTLQETQDGLAVKINELIDNSNNSITVDDIKSIDGDNSIKIIKKDGQVFLGTQMNVKYTNGSAISQIAINDITIEAGKDESATKKTSVATTSKVKELIAEESQKTYNTFWFKYVDAFPSVLDLRTKYETTASDDAVGVYNINDKLPVALGKEKRTVTIDIDGNTFVGETIQVKVNEGILFLKNDGSHRTAILLETGWIIDDTNTVLDNLIIEMEDMSDILGSLTNEVTSISDEIYKINNADEYKFIKSGTLKNQIDQLIDSSDDMASVIEEVDINALTIFNDKDLTENLDIPRDLPTNDAKIATRGAVRAVEARNLAKYDAVNDELEKIKQIAETALITENAALVEGFTITNKSHSVGTWIPAYDTEYEVYNEIGRYLGDGSEDPTWASKPEEQKYKAKSWRSDTDSKIAIYKIGSWKGTINGNITRLTAGQTVTVKARIKAFTRTKLPNGQYQEMLIPSATTELFGAAGITLNDQFQTHTLSFNRPFVVTAASINANSIASVLKFEIEIAGGDVRLSSGFQWIVEEDSSKSLVSGAATDSVLAKDAAAEGGANQNLINISNKAVKDATVGITRDTSKGHTIIDSVDLAQRAIVWDNATTRVAAINSKQVAYINASGDEAHRTLAEINAAGDTTDKTKTIASVQFVEESMNKVGEKLKLDPTKLIEAEAKIGITH